MSGTLIENIQRNGYDIVREGTVTTEWLLENNILACKGIIFWHLFFDIPKHRAIIKRWKEQHDDKGNSISKKKHQEQ